MIQELISTSAQRCLNGNAGFGIVAQTFGMAQNVSLAANALSGYTHIAPPGSANNPVAYLHAMRRTGGMERHFVSRIADCGNDYTGRSNRIAHHWIIEEEDVRLLPGGPAALTAQNPFHAAWKGRPRELPPRKLIVADTPLEKCTAWEKLTGDAGWGGIVAERAEKGDPISIVFPQEYKSENLRTLICEALALLPSSLRCKITFSTYFMESQESGSDKIQIKCFLAGSKESQFVRQSSNTLVLDLQQRLGNVPAGKYVEQARGAAKPPSGILPNAAIPVAATPVPLPEQAQSVPGTFALAEEPKMPMISVSVNRKNLDYATGKNFVSVEETPMMDSNWLIYLGLLMTIIVRLILFFVVQWSRSQAPPNPPLENNGAVQNGKVEKLLQKLEAAQNDIEQLKLVTLENERLKAAAEQKETEWAKEKKELEDKAAKTISELKIENQNLKKQENERQEIADGLQKLPKVWEGLESLLESGSVILEYSDFLHKYQDKVKIECVCFITGQHKVSPDGNTALNILIERNRLAEIKLVKEGLRFEWQPSRSLDIATADKYKILPSILRITIEGHPPHDIALWTPVTVLNIPSESVWNFFDKSEFEREYYDDEGNFVREKRKKFDDLKDLYAAPQEDKHHLEQLAESLKNRKEGKLYLVLPDPDKKDRLLLMKN